MRPIHLGIAFVVLALILAGLWTSVDHAPLEVRAASPFDPSADGQLDAAELAANEARNAAANAGRVALPSTTAADIAENAKAKSKPEKPVVTGRVVGPDGKGVGLATVWASTSQHWVQLPLDVEPDGLPPRWITVQKVEADAEGQFKFEDLKPGPLRVAARASGFAPAYLDHLDLPPYEEHSIGDVALERGVLVSGKVIDRDGKGVEGANVLIALDCVHRSSLVALPGRGVPACSTNAEGAFVVDQLAAGPWHLIVDAPGYVIAEADGKTEKAGERQTAIVVRLETGVDIRGKITAKDTALPGGLRVGARLAPEKHPTNPGEVPHDAGEEEAPPTTSNELRARYALVEADGTFVLHGLKPMSRYRLNVAQKPDEEHGWKPCTSVDSVLAQGGDKGVELVFKAESVLVFRVLDDATGLPLTELTVSAGVGRERALRDDKGEVVRKFEGGKVRYPELRPPATGGRPVILRVSANGYKDHENKNVPIKPGQELDLGDIRLQLERAVVATVVDDASGKPVASARVILCTKTDDELADLSRMPPEQDLWADTSVKYARTGADGKARLTSMPGKMTSLQASAKGFLPSEIARVMLPSDADHALELRLKHGGSVTVKVTDGFGHAVTGVGIHHKLPRRGADQDDNIDESRKTDNEGLVHYDALDPGVHGFRIHEDQGDVYFFENDGQNSDEPQWEETVVAALSTKTIEFTAPPRGTISGTIREGGQPLEGAHVKLVPRKENTQGGGMSYWSGQNDPFATVSDHTGGYKLQNLRCGDYSVLVTSTGRRMPAEFRATVSVEPRVFDFDLDLASVEGRVTDSDGRPLAGLTVNAYRSKGGLDVEPPYHMVVVEDERGNPNVNWEQITHTSERTDSMGRYVMKGLLTEEPLMITVSGEWVEQGTSPEITLSPNEARRGLDFALRAAGKIEITMVGNSPAGRQGWYQVKVARIEGEKEPQVVHQTYVGAWNRTQQMGSIVPGRYKVIVHAHENQAGAALLDQEVLVQAGQVTKVSFSAFPN